MKETKKVVPVEINGKRIELEEGKSYKLKSVGVALPFYAKRSPTVKHLYYDETRKQILVHDPRKSSNNINNLLDMVEGSKEKITSRRPKVAAPIEGEEIYIPLTNEKDSTLMRVMKAIIRDAKLTPTELKSKFIDPMELSNMKRSLAIRPDITIGKVEHWANILGYSIKIEFVKDKENE